MLVGRVDVVLAGHDHFYQKIRPQQGIQHIVSGGAGRLRSGVETSHPEVESAALRFHFLHIELTAENLTYQAVDRDGAVFDSRTLPKVLKAKATSRESEGPPAIVSPASQLGPPHAGH
jgi:hypothetical protein